MLYRRWLELAVGYGVSVHTTLPEPESLKTLLLENDFIPRSEVE